MRRLLSCAPHSQTCFTYVLEHTSESLEIFKLNLTWLQKVGENQPGSMFHGFFPRTFPFLGPDWNHATSLEPFIWKFFYTTQPNQPSTLQRTEFFSGEDLVKFHHIFLGGRQTKFFLAGFLGGLFGTAHFWHSNRFLAQKSYLHTDWRHGRHTKALCQKEDDAYGSIRMIFAFMFFGSHTCFERLHFNRSAGRIKEAMTWPVCLSGTLAANWGPTGATKDKLGVVAVIFCTNLRAKHMFHLWCLMSLTKLAAQKKAPGVSEGAE